MKNKIYNKHLFFIKKDLNWDLMPEDRKYKKVFEYVMGINRQDNKRQELARIIHNKNLTHDQLLELAINITIS